MTSRIAKSSALVIAAALALTGCTTSARPGTEKPVLEETMVAPVLEELPTISSPVAPSERLAEGLIPPTNRWFSGLVFGDEPLPVFPSPLSFALTESGFEFGLPTINAVPGLIAGGFIPAVSIDADAAQQVTRYDDVSVTLTGSRDGEEIATTTIARGSPTISYVAQKAHELTLTVPFDGEGEGLFVAEAGGVEYAVLAPDAELVGSGTILSLPADSTAVFFVVPPSASPEDFAQSVAAIESVDTAYEVEGEVARTTLTYRTRGGQDTLIGALPHQTSKLEPSCDAGGFETVRGAMRLCVGQSLAWDVDTVEPAAALALDDLTPEERNEVLAAARTDLADAAALPTDTYFGGKALARLATILQLARTLDDDALSEQVGSTLAKELRRWAEPDGCERRSEQCFVYDDVLKGVVGQAPSFGSEQFNDHHFHYGYFLFAAAIAVEGDDDLRDDLSPVMTAVAADIASGTGNALLPARRAFDPYMGHSYASGFSPFADGNNQESSSEAVSAWNGLALWAQATDDEPLEEQARWMLSAEAGSALAYWLAFDTDEAPFDSYGRSVAGIVWDGKTDYATWFSPEHSAVLGIQLVPMAPVATEYLAHDPDRIRTNIEEIGAPGQFADYLLMYEALAGPEHAARALDEARELSEDQIDDGNSRAYLLAWIMART